MIGYSDLQKLNLEDVRKVTVSTQNKGASAVATDAIVQLKDGTFLRVAIDENGRDQATDALARFIGAVAQTNQVSPSTIMTQYGKNHMREYQQVVAQYDDFTRRADRQLKIKKVLAAAGIATVAGLGMVACSVANNAKTEQVQTESEENSDVDENATEKFDINGATWEEYVANAPEGIQKDFYKGLYDKLNALNQVMGQITYEKDGVTSRLGLTAEEMRLLLLASNEYSTTIVDENGNERQITNDEYIAYVMNGERLDTVTVLSDRTGEKETMNPDEALRVVYEKFHLLFSMKAVDPTVITDIFENQKDKEVCRRLLEGHNRVMNATTDEERTEAAKAQRQLWQDMYTSNLNDSDVRYADEVTAFATHALFQADSVVARMYNIKGEAKIYHTNSKGTVIEDTKKADLYDPEFKAYMSNAKDFNPETVLKQDFGISNPDSYFFGTYALTNESSSVTDRSCSSLYEKFDSYNEFISDMPTKDAMEREAFIDSKIGSGESLDEVILASKEVTFLSRIHATSYPVQQIDAIIDGELQRMNNFPKNVHNLWDYFVEYQENVKNSYSASKTGSSKKTSTGTAKDTLHVNSTAEDIKNNKSTQEAKKDLMNRGLAEAEAEAKIDEAQKQLMESVKNQYINPVTDKEAKAIEQKADEQLSDNHTSVVYDTVYQYAYNYYSTTGTGPSDEANYLNNKNHVIDGANQIIVNITVADAYNDGKTAGLGVYYNNLVEKAENGDVEARKKAIELGLITESKQDMNVDSEYIKPGSVSTDPGSSNGKTAEDVIKDSNNENTNTPENTTGENITPHDVVPPAEIPGGDLGPQQGSGNFTPFVDPNQGNDAGDGSVEYWDPDRIVDEFNKQNAASTQSADQIETQSLEAGSPSTASANGEAAPVETQAATEETTTVEESESQEGPTVTYTIDPDYFKNPSTDSKSSENTETSKTAETISNEISEDDIALWLGETPVEEETPSVKTL